MKFIKKIRSLFFKYFTYLLSGNSSILACKINGFCFFNGNEKFGKNVNFNACKVYGKGEVTFGDNFHSGKKLNLLTTYHNYNGNKIPYDETVITKNIIIEDNVWIGMNVIILGGITIGEGAIIQAGSVVSSNIDRFSIAGGNPARKFKERDIDAYMKLKENNQFF